ncbi:glycosyltransferase [Candidatus Omnitrophota bacterium]
MKKIKVLRIIARLNIGGPAIHTILLTEGLDLSRFESILVSGSISKAEGDMSYYADKKQVKPLVVPRLRRELSLFNDIAALRSIYRIIKAQEPDIVHTHTAKAGALGRLAAIIYNFLNRKKRVKIVHTFHGHVLRGYFGRFKSRIFIFIERFLGMFTDIIVTVSASVARELLDLEICKKAKIKVIPLGFELDELLAIPPETNGGSIVNIGIIGRLVPVKNHRLFLEAAAKLLKDKQYLNLRFKIVGDGELRDELEGCACRLGIASRVEFLGWKMELAKVYSVLEVVVLTSINEGTPVSLIEAMASARPVVSTEAGGVRDLLGENLDSAQGKDLKFRIMERGIIVDSKDPADFAAALAVILRDNRLRRDIGLRGREFAAKIYSKDRLIGDIQNLYCTLLSAKYPT